MAFRNWWNKLHYNWKKIILINLDFGVNDLHQFKSLDHEILISSQYDAYFKKFKIGIRKRLDIFKGSEEELSDILNIDYFILRHTGIKDLTPIGSLYNIKFLSLTESFTKDLIEIEPLKKLEYLSISCANLEEFNTSLVLIILKK